MAKSLGLTIGVENHLDFTVEELHDLIRSDGHRRDGGDGPVSTDSGVGGETIKKLAGPLISQSCCPWSARYRVFDWASFEE